MNVEFVEEQFHGGLDYRELEKLGKSPEQILDLSSNILSVQHPRSVREALSNASISSYPDRNSRTLVQRIADRHAIEPKQVLVGNGCCELIYLLASSLLSAASRVLVLEPTFSEYRRASEIAGATIETCFAPPEDKTFNLPSELAQRLTRPMDLVWICNPNNPTGEAFHRVDLEQLANCHPNTLFVVDESYIEFAERAESVINTQCQNLICLRSLTKSHALAGVRLGYLVASEAVVQSLTSRRVPWSVSSIAQTLGIAALEAQSHYDQAIEEMRECRRRLHDEMTHRNLEPTESDANFLLVPVDNGEDFRKRLLDEDILVRNCESFGLPDYVRISVGNSESIDRLLSALDGAFDPQATVTTQTLPAASTKDWGPDFRGQLNDLFRLRRDVRRFLTDPIPAGSVERWVDAACLAPSVGLSEPWRFVSVQEARLRAEVASEFETQNALAADDYADDERDHYLRLKLAGIREAPEQLAVFVVPTPEQGRGLGRRTMPETVEYSVVAAIQNFWLAARAEGVGIGWVSILRGDRVNEILDVPKDWRLIAYLCIGYPIESMSETPTLEREGWEQRSKRGEVWTTV